MTGGSDPDTTVYDDEKAVFLMTRDTSPYTPLAWWYWEGPWIGTDYSYWMVYGPDDPATIDPNNWDTVTYTFRVTDQYGTDLAYYHYNLVVDFVADDSGSYGVTTNNKGLFTNVFDKYLDGSIFGIDGAIYNSTMVKITGTTFDEQSLTLPQWVFYGDEYAATEKPYKIRFLAIVNESGTLYYSNWVTVDTANGDTAVTLTVNGYTTSSPPTEEKFYITFYGDEDKQTYVNLNQFNITVVKSNNFDGANGVNQAYSLLNPHTLEVPADVNFDYLVVTLKDSQNNTVFTKSYDMSKPGVYDEILYGIKPIVTLHVYDTSTQTYLQNFTAFMTRVDSSNVFADVATNGTAVLLVDKGTYVVDIYKDNALIYSAVLDVQNNIETTYSVNVNWSGYVKYSLYDVEGKKVNVGNALTTYKLVFEAKDGGFKFEVPNTNVKYSLIESNDNNEFYYFIRTSNELSAWTGSGFYVFIYDRQTNTLLKTLFYQMDTNPDSFAIILPAIVMDNGNTATLPYSQTPISPEQRDEMTRKSLSAIFEYLFEKGLIVVLASLFIAAELGGTLGLMVGLALILAFTWMGMVPKTFGALASLGLGAGLVLMVAKPTTSRGEE